VRNRLKYALTAAESLMIIKRRKIRLDGKVRTDPKYPVGLMDVIHIPETKQPHYRLLFDVKGRQALVKITEGEATMKLLKVRKVMYTHGRVPIASCHDGRVIRYPDPLLKKNDTIVFDTERGVVTDWVRFKLGRMAIITGGANTGRVGVITKIERHPGSFHIVHVRDKAGHSFATRIVNVFIIGREDSMIALPADGGIRSALADDRERRIEKYRKIKEGEVKAGGKKRAKKHK